MTSSLKRLRFLKATAHHMARYEWARQFVGDVILEAACGVGYGGPVLQKPLQIVGVDASASALAFAARYNSWAYVGLVQGRIEDEPWRDDFDGFDTVVSIETIEHLSDDVAALRCFARTAPRLVGTVPNQLHYPFVPAEHAADEYPHQRHYTPEQLEGVLGLAGWDLKELWHQPGELIYDAEGRRTGKRIDAVLKPGPGGLFLGFVAERKP